MCVKMHSIRVDVVKLDAKIMKIRNTIKRETQFILDIKIPFTSYKKCYR